MLVELRVKDLGVIDDVVVELGSGATALTGETGAGKTLLVDALVLLLGGRADQRLVRPGADQTLVEGRFVSGDDEVILARAVPAQGRSRAWVDGRMVPVSTLATVGSGLVEVHGQHAHQALLDPGAQRRALDTFGGADLSGLAAARSLLHELEVELSSLGGDMRTRAREVDLLCYQLNDIDGAGIDGSDEDERLADEEELLAGASARRAAVIGATAVLEGDAPSTSLPGIVDMLGSASAMLEEHHGTAAFRDRILGLQAEVVDVLGELRDVADRWEDDPQRLDQVRQRRHVLHQLRDKYGATLTDVLAYAEQSRRRLHELQSLDERAAALEVARDDAVEALTEARRLVGEARRAAAPQLAAAVEHRLRRLAMAQAKVAVSVGDEDPGDDVVFMLGANPGEPLVPLATAASGGELARAMLALRLVLSGAPPTMVFDEVDAGIGGEAALAVGQALAEIGRTRQVLVVTHLAQVAAFADRHLLVRKMSSGTRTVATVGPVDGADRIVELARMLSGHPGSEVARRHATELLAAAQSVRADGVGSGPAAATVPPVRSERGLP